MVDTLQQTHSNLRTELNLTALSPQVSIAAQLYDSDIKAVVDGGFKALVCMIPDGEWDGNQPFDAIATEAKKFDLAVGYVPIYPPQLTQEDIAKFSATMAELPKPVLLYCRTGIRCKRVWEMSQTCE